MRSFTHRAWLWALAAVAVVLVAGCASPAAPVVPPASPSVTPVFASDEDALAAAKDAYGKYTSTSDLISTDGGKDPDRIDAVATGDLAESAHEGFKQLADSGWRSTGTTDITSFTGQEVDETATPAVIAYVCVDVSGVDVLDASGKSVVSPTRPDQQAFQVSFDLKDRLLMPSAREPWTGSGVCM